MRDHLLHNLIASAIQMVIQTIFAKCFLPLSWFLAKALWNCTLSAIRQECSGDSQTNSHFPNGNLPRLDQGEATVHRQQMSCMDP